MGHIQENRYKNVIKKIVKLQSIVKMVNQRKRFLKVKSATIIIQKAWKNQLIANQERFEFLNKKTSAIIIQSHWRRHMAEIKFQNIIENITKIQSYVRMVSQKKKFEKLKNATLVIQGAWRNTLFTKKIRDHYLDKRKSAIILQSYCRRYLAIKEYKIITQKVIKIQSLFRMLIAKRKFNRLKGASIILQRAWRNKKIANNIRNSYVEKKKAIIILQNYWRMHIQENRYKNVVKKIVKLQSIVKMVNQRKRFLKVKSATIIIQKAWKNQLIANQERFEFLNKKTSAIIIQSHWRRHMAEIKFQNIIENITKIQSYVRMVSQKKKFEKLKNATLVIQG